MEAKKSRLGSIFSGLIRRKQPDNLSDNQSDNLPNNLSDNQSDNQTDNVNCSMISHIDELIKVTDFTNIEDLPGETKTEQTTILENNSLLTNLVMEYPVIRQVESTPLQIPKIPKIVKLSLSTKGKTLVPISYSFYKCNMLMEYSSGAIYNFDNDLILNPGKYDIGAKYDGINLGLKFSLSDYSMGDDSKFYKTETLTDFNTVIITKKTKISFFAFPKIMGNSYDINLLDITVNLIE